MSGIQNKGLNEAQKNKGRIMKECAPVGWFDKYRVTTEPKNYKELKDMIEVFAVYLHDLSPVMADRIYSRLKNIDEGQDAIH